MSEKTTILIQAETREKLKALGKKGQTYDQIIHELIIRGAADTNE